jgi:hypothetical protein
MPRSRSLPGSRWIAGFTAACSTPCSALDRDGFTFGKFDSWGSAVELTRLAICEDGTWVKRPDVSRLPAGHAHPRADRRAHRLGAPQSQCHSGVPLAQIDRAIAEPLRPLLAAWLYEDEITESDDRQWRLR